VLSVEQEVSKQLHWKRACRKAFLAVLSFFTTAMPGRKRRERLKYIQANAVHGFAQSVCRDIRWERKRLDRYDPRRRPNPNRGFVSEMIILWDWKPVFQFCLLLLFLAFIVAVSGGYIEIALRQRGRNWARTGSFSL
jgi:hypothetical protein